ncbi:hypothetical protein [Citrobacter sp. wls619]|uniref:hypothetical protein n=1 Tax=Citrobacter sp. wls619 TaxID=2576432 RepID=UPI001BAEEC35|nr:hypothetical protein [Citrobacter sp. wls619]
MAEGYSIVEIIQRDIINLNLTSNCFLMQKNYDELAMQTALLRISTFLSGLYSVFDQTKEDIDRQYIKNQPGMDASKYSLKYSEKSIGYGIYQGSQMSPYPGILGGFGGSVISEWTGNVTQKEANGESK